LSTSIACNASIDKDSLISELAPKFVWVLRDFTLEKVDPISGQEISSNEYLEMCMRNKISGKNSAENNLIRENILKYFKNRECVTLPRPVEKEEDLQNLKQIPLENLKPNFRVEFMNLKSKIYQHAQPKKINGQKLNGLSLANLLVEFVNSINSGSVPNISNAWDNVINEDIKEYFEKALRNFKENVKSAPASSSENLTQFVLNQKYDAIMTLEKVTYLNPDILSNEAYHKLYSNSKNKLENEMSTIENKIYSENKTKNIKSCNDAIKKEYKSMVDKLFRNTYTSKGNFEELTSDYIQALKNYDKNSISEVDKLNILTNYLTDQNKEIIYYIVTNVK
jgi:hypothetical protein